MIEYNNFITSTIFQEKESSQLYRCQFFEINSLMAETIKNQFSKTQFF